ncbi:pimeloyl-ACP methyl ester carboxylesterase [Anoxybacillus vitaminiphilus]|uniref:Pimeloyl-ACP methyl ester carboxylesterase n=1 Tax=Paranoxybacillus vitaminiphilus TaxID=581036 RepID=A0A327YHA4_9BACL|nr:alpha/beta hydrolase [Anoxybacillus vitaminiphilus]RAK19891.1 pimeloyl-ACP methyl ester carboxylesterase [Anoxybacillus vitaminiphilus]
MSYYKTNDADIYYEYIRSADPNAETIVLAHGLGLDLTTWKFLIPYLQDFHLLMFDFRGHGRTVSKAYEINWKTLYKDFKNLLHFLEIKRYHYAGHGLGGHFGIELFSTFGEKAMSFTLLSTPCYYPEKVAQKAIQFREKIASFLNPNDFADFMIPQILYDRTAEKYELVKEAYLRSDQAKHIDFLKLIAQSLSLEKLTAISIPTLLLSGEFDTNYPPSLTTISSNYFPQCKTYIIPDSSNLVFVDRPQLVSEHIKRFYFEKQKFINRAKDRTIFPYLEELNKHLYSKKDDVSEHSLQIHFLHQFNIAYGTKKIEGQWNRRKAKEIISYLAICKKVSRDKLIEVFWPDLPLPKAQNQLRVSLSHLRKILGDYQFIIKITNKHVQITENYQCDVLTLRQKLHEYQFTEDEYMRLSIAAELLNIWKGNILEDFYDNWAVELKRELEDLLLALFEDAYALSIRLEKRAIALQFEKILKESKGEINDIRIS